MLPKIDPNYFCWVIAYIQAEYISKVTEDLERFIEYKEVEAYIPTVKVLKKKFKGKDQFDEIPLLFNYGFFRVPRKFATSKLYLDNMQKNISCIYSWVKDPLKTPRKNRIRPEGTRTYSDHNIHIATATSEEIYELLKGSFLGDIHDSTEVDRLKPGDTITLRGYPWEGIIAEVMEINKKGRDIKVKITLFGEAKQEVTVSFDNVFFTVYHNKSYDDSISSTESIDAMEQFHTLNKKLYKNAQNKTD